MAGPCWSLGAETAFCGLNGVFFLGGGLYLHKKHSFLTFGMAIWAKNLKHFTVYRNTVLGGRYPNSLFLVNLLN